MVTEHNKAPHNSDVLLEQLPKPPIVFSDFDGTLTNHTDFSPLFLDILDFLDSHNTPFVIVTGRSVSWGHFLLTHFPSIKHVIAEGGGIHTFKQDDGNIVQNLLVEALAPKKLSQITEALLQDFPDLALSADSTGRVTDRAIELEALEQNHELFEAVKSYLAKAGAQYSTSNVHLNFWCGAFDKMTAISSFIEKHTQGIDLKQCVFFGDSLNDQSVFAHMPGSIGVANLQAVEHRLTHKPAVILRDEAHHGPAGVLYALEKLFKYR